MKNDLTCGVVRDLLPSYVEGLTSPESNAAVERHLVRVPGMRPASDGAGRRAGAGGPRGRKRGRLSEKSKAPGLAACGGGSCRHGAAVRCGRRGKAVSDRHADPDARHELGYQHGCAGTTGHPGILHLVRHGLPPSGKRSRSRRGSSASPAVRYCPLPSVIPVITGPSSTRRASTRSIWEIN